MQSPQRLYFPCTVAVWCLYIMTLMAAPASAQSFFRSGSTGADGAFSPAKDVIIDMNTKPNGIWHYTTINIPAGVTVTFKPNAANTPVIWLASGEVIIAGVINLDGANGGRNNDPGNEARGGPGGFRGGRGNREGEFVNPLTAATPGDGPGGGLPGSSSNACGGGGGYATVGGGDEVGGPAYGDILLRSLFVGGSGGGGGAAGPSGRGFNGGGGGGAILIASSSTIRFTNANGGIGANGGTGFDPTCCPGNGGGGSG